MNVFDKFFKKFSYKFDKGYPDMNNEQDVLLLESILDELNIDLNEGDAEDGIQILKKEFDFKDEDFSKVSGTRYKVLVPRAERFDYAQKMDALDDFQFDLLNLKLKFFFS